MSDQISYGPLESLIGTWEGNKGMDISPEPEGTEENPYYETWMIRTGGSFSLPSCATRPRPWRSATS